MRDGPSTRLDCSPRVVRECSNAKLSGKRNLKNNSCVFRKTSRGVCYLKMIEFSQSGKGLVKVPQCPPYMIPSAKAAYSQTARTTRTRGKVVNMSIYTYICIRSQSTVVLFIIAPLIQENS
jgi:hypothetical protein